MPMLGLVLALLLVASLIDATAAAPVVRWSRAAGTDLSAVAAVPGGGAVVTGARSTKGSLERPALLVRRYGPDGSVLWSRSWRTSKIQPTGNDVAIGADGSVYVAGLAGCVGFENAGFFVRKYGPQGRLRWTRLSPGGPCRDAETATGVAVRGGLVVVVGHRFGCCDVAADDGWIRAYRPRGTLRWMTDFEAPGYRDTNDAAMGVAIGGLGRIYVVGEVETAPRDDTTQMVDHEAVVQKLTSTGTVIWTRVMHDRGIKDNDVATSISVRGDRVMMLALLNWRGGSGPWGGPGWLGRFTFGGNLVWSRWLRGRFPAAVAVTASGRTLVTGTVHRRLASRGSDLFLRRYATRGSLDWEALIDRGSRYVRGSDVADTRGGAYVSGNAGSTEPTGRLWKWST